MEASIPSTGKGPLANLAARRAAGEIHADPVQEKVVLRLQAIHDQLAAMANAQPVKTGFFARLGLGHAPKPPEGPHGLYIWGSVGRGKSMLMDLFFADAPVAKKRRVHFHEFMLEVQARLHRRREELAPGAHRRNPTRSCRSARKSPPKRGCSASTNSRSPISPMR